MSTTNKCPTESSKSTVSSSKLNSPAPNFFLNAAGWHWFGHCVTILIDIIKF